MSSPRLVAAGFIDSIGYSQPDSMNAWNRSATIEDADGGLKFKPELQEVLPNIVSTRACESGSLDALLKAADEYGASSLEAVERLDAWVVSGSHVQYLNRLLIDDVRSRILATNSSMHPNGFAKLALSTPRRGCALRMHVWRSAASSGDVHNHINDYSSRLLIGRLRIRRFEISENGSACQRFIASRCDSPKGYQMTPNGKVNLAQVQEFLQTRRVQRAYSQEAQTIHSVVSLSRVAVTLFLLGPPCRPTSDVFRLSEPEAHYSKATPVSTAAYIRHISAVARCMNRLATITT